MSEAKSGITGLKWPTHGKRRNIVLRCRLALAYVVEPGDVVGPCLRVGAPDVAIARPEGRSRPSSTGYGRA
jgi:hypothetical protein